MEHHERLGDAAVPQRSGSFSHRCRGREDAAMTFDGRSRSFLVLPTSSSAAAINDHASADFNFSFEHSRP
jgi:hypothetical protein